ncbi:uncharacterized protein LOC125998742 [Suncus etruscus]|uniref:uncharacterized protein LOC125998742 n=1 Tax=Suncus etruscus TaxID=109475 RepID=UPI0021104EC7|nr:uncharacterized protein LOC125998742 [Suncus etruscus]XP_049622769.1 uncharacterized protein LOC125998742 [Suncus etruscus]XP_049622770.1 uncharacterized protein LOC125998742 [Suncus etruscus]
MGNYLSRHLGSYLHRYVDTSSSALLPEDQQHQPTPTRSAFSSFTEAQFLTLPKSLQFQLRSSSLAKEPPDLVQNPQGEGGQRAEGRSPLLGTPMPCTFLGQGGSRELQGVLKPVLMRSLECPTCKSLANTTPPIKGVSEADAFCFELQNNEKVLVESMQPLHGPRKVKRRLDMSKGLGNPEAKKMRGNPEYLPSAFQPVWKDGMVRMFVPQPGPLRTTMFP